MLVEEWKRKNPPIKRKPITHADRIRSMTATEFVGCFDFGSVDFLYVTDERLTE